MQFSSSSTFNFEVLWPFSISDQIRGLTRTATLMLH